MMSKDQKVRTKYERLSYNGSPLMQVEQGEMHLFRDDGSAGPVYPFDWTLPAVASIFPRPENKKLTWFKEYVKQILVIQVIPQMMTKDSNQEETMPSQHPSRISFPGTAIFPRIKKLLWR